MTEKTKTVSFLVVAVAFLSLAWATRPAPYELDPTSEIGKPFFPEFDDPLAAASLEVIKYDDETAQTTAFKVAKVNNVWSIPSKLNYPADAENQLAEVAASLMGLTKEGVADDKPGNHEIVMGMTWRELIYDLGGGIPDGRTLKAWIPGGASAPWFVPEEHLETIVSIDDVASNGSMIGAGAVVVMDDTTNVVAVAHRIVRFFAHESCGQCTPCREGTSWMEAVLKRILDGDGRPEDIDLLLDISDNISPGLAWPPAMTTICPLGPSAVSPITSITRWFRPEVEAMIAGSEVGSG